MRGPCSSLQVHTRCSECRPPSQRQRVAEHVQSHKRCCRVHAPRRFCRQVAVTHIHQGTMRRARDASKIAPRDRYRYPTEYRALKTRCRGHPSEAKCAPHRDDPKIQTQMTAPCLTRSTLRGHALGNASRTGRTPPTTSSFQKVREETPHIKISRVCPGDHKEKEASCCSGTTDMPYMPLVTLGCTDY